MKGNDGRGARRKQMQRLAWIASCVGIGLLLVLTVVGKGGSSAKKAARALGEKARHKLRRHSNQFRQDLHLQHEEKDESELLQMALDAKIHLVELDVVEEEMMAAPANTYEGIYGKFCRLDWKLHKQDPSKVPMFRDLVGQSEDCENNMWKLSLKKLVTLAKQQDRTDGSAPKALNLTAVVFHESRCGSTLVANALAAMDPVKHRAYSESAPPATAFKAICGENFSRCTKEQAAAILRDTIYIMSRSDDPKEERVFFKFQSITSKFLQVFQLAYPETPWMFIYRDPVQVMMSHIKDDVTLKHANCARSRYHPPGDIDAIARAHGHSSAKELVPEEYCAAHLAAITENAVRALSVNSMGIPVNYVDLPNALYETILPKIFGRPLTSEEVSNIQAISSQYSKGRADRGHEFQGDSEQKEKAASETVRTAAAKFLQESYDHLSNYQPKLLQ